MAEDTFYIVITGILGSFLGTWLSNRYEIKRKKKDIKMKYVVGKYGMMAVPDDSSEEKNNK